MPSDEHARPQLDRLTSRVESLPLAPSVVGGIGTFVGGYSLFVVLVALSGNVAFANPVSVLKQIGNLFFNAHNVPLIRYREVTVGDETIEQEATVNLLQQAEPALPRSVYYAVPVVVIAIVATVLVYRYVDTTDPVETGASVVGGMALGYVLAALLASFLVAQRTSIESAFETLSPAGVETLVFGIAYPAVVTALVAGLFVIWMRWQATHEPA